MVGPILWEFDLWLKKCEISEKLGRARPVLPSPPSKVTAESTEPAKPTKPPKSTSGETSDSLPSLTPEEKEKYDDYWKQFKPSGESPAASPSGSVPSTTTKTPDCKKRLDLGEGLRGCLCKCKYAFFGVMLSIHVWSTLYSVFKWPMCPGESREKAPKFCP